MYYTAFHLIVIISPLNRMWLFISVNLNTPYKRIMWTKFSWFWPICLKVDRQCIFTIKLLSCLIKWFIWTNLIPIIYSRILCASLVQIGCAVLGEQTKFWNFITRKTIDNRQISIRKAKFTWVFCSGELKSTGSCYGY